MLKRDEILTYLQENKEIFHELFGIRKIGLFGSFAREQQTELSDVDILIEMDSMTENIFDKRLQLQELLMTRFTRKVDICHEQAIKPFFRDLILKEAIYAWKRHAIVHMMLETIEKIFLFTSDLEDDESFQKDIKSFDATIMNFIILGESVGK